MSDLAKNDSMMNNSAESDSFVSTDKFNNNNNNKSSMDMTPSSSRTDFDSFNKHGTHTPYSSTQMDSGNHTNTFYSTSTPIVAKKDSSAESDQLNESANSSANSSSANISINATGNNNMPLNEKVASLASSIYTELEKIVKLHGRDTVKDLMSILVNILEALDVAYQEKEEQIVENELLKDDYEKLLNQYEREKQSRKDTELKLFQSEDSFAEQKREYEEKVKSLESIVRMIDLKSKNTSDHVIRLEEKENELKREYNKLHERYTELFKTHCDYMERTKMLFGNENNNFNSTSGGSSGGVSSRLKLGQQQQQQSAKSEPNSSSSSKLIDLLRSPNANINRNDLINALKTTTRSELNLAINNLLSQELNQSNESGSTSTIAASSTSSLASLSSQQTRQQSNDSTNNINNNTASDITINEKLNEDDDDNVSEETSRSKLNIQTSENFDEHLSSNCVEFDDTASVDNNLNNKDDEEEEISTKNDLSLFNELSRENYDITELDDGADLTGMTREVANLIRENSELLQTKHALNVLKDDLIVRLDQFSSEMVILREEIKSLQTVKACLQLRISELEEEAKKSKEEFAQKLKKQEEDDENVPMSQRKRFTRAEMARVLMERNQYKERLIDLQEAVRWTEMMRASKADPAINPPSSIANLGVVQTQPVSSNTALAVTSDSSNAASSEQNPQEHKKKSTVWKFFSDLFGSSSNATVNSTSPANHHHQHQANTLPKLTSSQSSNVLLSPSTKKALVKQNDQAVPHNELDQTKDDSKLKQHSSEASKLVAKEEGRMQAYGWSLPSKASLDVAKANTTITVPVPVYCRPLFEQDNNLKLSCSSTVNYLFDSKCVKNCADIIESSRFSHFKSQTTNNNTEYKSSCIWICNLNDNDTHVSVLDANRPSELIEQFVLKYLKIYCIQSISGANQNEYPLSEDKLRNMSKNLKETNSSLILAKKSETDSSQDNTENINYIECEYDQDNNFTSKQSDNVKLDRDTHSAVNNLFNQDAITTSSTSTNTKNNDINNNETRLQLASRCDIDRKNLVREDSIKTKKKKMKYSLTTYMIELIRFYNFFIRIQKFILLNFLFLYTLAHLIRLPFYFFFSFLFSNLNYGSNEAQPLIEEKKEEIIKVVKQEPKRRKSFIDRTLLNHLVRKSTDKRFVKKYFGQYIDCENDDEFESKFSTKRACEMNARLVFEEKEQEERCFLDKNTNIVLINEMKSNVDTHGSIKLEKKAFLNLNNCVEINPTNDSEEVKNHQEKILTSLYPTMWMGSHDGWILVHSSISNISKTIDKVKLKDAILSIVQNGGRVIAGLADGTIALFHRNADGLWDLKNFYVINFDRPHHSIRCLINVYDTIWCSCRNKIFVFNPDEFKLVSTIEVHPRRENQVRHMAWCDEGVWVSLRLDSTLRLYHARTQQHLQYLDIEPFITRMLGTSNLGLSLVRISSLIVGSKRLWVGTGNGVILSLPFGDFPKEANTPYSSKLATSNSSNAVNLPGSVVRVSNDQTSKIPYCNLSEAQFSFHGHRNAIKFFLSVPSEAFQKQSSKSVVTSLNSQDKAKEYEKVETTLILSGGHGYIDFRIGDTVNKSTKEKNLEQMDSNKSERAHLIVWQLNSN